MARMDRRIFPRYRMRLEAQIVTPERNMAAEMTEISLFGVRIESFRAVNPGTCIAVCIEFHGKIVLKGTVLWARDTSDMTGQNYIVGVETDSIWFAGQEACGLTDRRKLLNQIIYGMESDVEPAAHFG